MRIERIAVVLETGGRFPVLHVLLKAGSVSHWRTAVGYHVGESMPLGRSGSVEIERTDEGIKCVGSVRIMNKAGKAVASTGHVWTSKVVETSSDGVAAQKRKLMTE